MAIQVLNSSSQLDGKTIVTTEATETITGAKTFDLDPSAPFIVTAGSAKVTNLDADKLDGLNASDLTSFTPTWGNTGTSNSLGNGTLLGNYFQIGKFVYFNITLAWGTTTSSGNGTWTFSLPKSTNTLTYASINVYMLDSSASLQLFGSSLGRDATTFTPIYYLVSGTKIAVDGITATAPFTWAANDTLVATGVMIAASTL